MPAGPRRLAAVRPRRRRRRREGPLRCGPGSTDDLLYLLCGGKPVPADGHLVHPPRRRADDDPRRRRPHAPAGPVDPDRDQPRHPARRGRSWTSRSGTSTTRAPSRSRRSTSTRSTRSRSPAGTCSGCATGCRPSRARTTGTSCGARAPPTRCAWGSCRHAPVSDERPAQDERAGRTTSAPCRRSGRTRTTRPTSWADSRPVLTDAGHRVVCVTATRGEAGGNAADLAELRTAELEAALAVLGVEEHRWLDYPDGGCDRVDRRRAAASRIRTHPRRVGPEHRGHLRTEAVFTRPTRTDRPSGHAACDRAREPHRAGRLSADRPRCTPMATTARSTRAPRRTTTAVSQPDLADAAGDADRRAAQCPLDCALHADPARLEALLAPRRSTVQPRCD